MMRNNILQQVQAEYEQLRMRNAMEDRRRREAVDRDHPDLAEALDARQQLIFGSMRSILNGQAAYSDLPKRMDVMNRRVDALLKQYGYAADWLDPVCRCKACRDTGYVGETIREMCSCMRNEYYARLYREVGLGDAADQSFERFDLSIFPDKPVPQLGVTQRMEMKLIRAQCKEWAEKYPDTQVINLVLSGQSGLGKTYMMHAMAKVLLDRGLNVLIVSAYRFLDMARKAYFDRQAETMDNLLDADVLMLDDLGSEPLMENITVVQLFNLINERQLRGKATVVSTNLTEKELRERYTERVASRLLDKRIGTFIPFYGDDVRRV